MKNFALLFVLFCSCQLFASDRFYNRLDRLYRINPDKCLVVVKKKIKKEPKEAAPYFFATKLYADKSEKNTRLKARYAAIYQSIGYAVKFERYSGAILEEKVVWENEKSALNKKIVNLLKELKEQENNKWIKLVKKHNKLFSDKIALPKEKEKENKKHFSREQKDYILNEQEFDIDVSHYNEHDFTSDGIYMGMPTGDENILSASFEEERKLLAILNEFRKLYGMNELEWGEDLARAARYHAHDMATQNYFSHQSYDGYKKAGNTFERIRAFHKSSFVNSENIAAGNSTAVATFLQWYYSPGHFKNMFNPSSKKVGIGVVYDPSSKYGYYWVFDSAR